MTTPIGGDIPSTALSLFGDVSQLLEPSRITGRVSSNTSIDRRRLLDVNAEIGTIDSEGGRLEALFNNPDTSEQDRRVAQTSLNELVERRNTLVEEQQWLLRTPSVASDPVETTTAAPPGAQGNIGFVESYDNSPPAIPDLLGGLQDDAQFQAAFQAGTGVVGTRGGDTTPPLDVQEALRRTLAAQASTTAAQAAVAPGQATIETTVVAPRLVGDTASAAAAATNQQPAAPPYVGPPAERQTDYRLRLRAITGQEQAIYGPAQTSNVLAPLWVTNGLLFPYTPSISFTQSVEYQSNPPVHSNSDFLSYTRTATPEISITGKFTVQNHFEAHYAVAALHFLRVVSKMHFGETDRAAGLPPPILVLSGYGTYMFNGTRVVLKSHNWQFDENIDHVNITTASGTARVPAIFSISLSLQVIHTPKAARKLFNLQQFRTGALMLRGQGWI